jgi:hypothetical protein
LAPKGSVSFRAPVEDLRLGDDLDPSVAVQVGDRERGAAVALRRPHHGAVGAFEQHRARHAAADDG